MRCRATARFGGRRWRLPPVVHARIDGDGSWSARTAPLQRRRLGAISRRLIRSWTRGAARAPPSCQEKLDKRGAELKDEMDSLMDEIDEVLEENAEEFVKNYVQRGGE